ncbi:MAG: SDR family oxidoreductase [Proteobacteria bacterium]|nr:SDR family oxidoreductase [Pseudomonadota bacterium]
MQLSAKNLRVVVTAGAAGIGRVIAKTFLDAGARVEVCDAAEAALAECRKVLPAVGTTLADVADAAQVDRFFAAAKARLGGLDVLVNNAGISGPTAAVEDIKPAEWDRTIAINLSGMFYAARAAVPMLKQAGGGSMINISSVAGRIGYPLRLPYASTKFAIVGFTESLARELGPSNIRVNCIQPGVVEGPRIDRVIAAKAEALGISFDEQKARLLANVSLRRMVSAQDIANMALFLATDAGKNISGQSLSVCGNVETLA